MKGTLNADGAVYIGYMASDATILNTGTLVIYLGFNENGGVTADSYDLSLNPNASAFIPAGTKLWGLSETPNPGTGATVGTLGAGNFPLIAAYELVYVGLLNDPRYLGRGVAEQPIVGKLLAVSDGSLTTTSTDFEVNTLGYPYLYVEGRTPVGVASGLRHFNVAFKNTDGDVSYSGYYVPNYEIYGWQDAPLAGLDGIPIRAWIPVQGDLASFTFGALSGWLSPLYVYGCTRANSQMKYKGFAVENEHIPTPKNGLDTAVSGFKFGQFEWSFSSQASGNTVVIELPIYKGNVRFCVRMGAAAALTRQGAIYLQDDVGFRMSDGAVTVADPVGTGVSAFETAVTLNTTLSHIPYLLRLTLPTWAGAVNSGAIAVVMTILGND